MTATLTRYHLLRPRLSPLGLARYDIKLWRPDLHPRDPRTGRFIPRPGGPKRRRRPSARNHVASFGAWNTVERVRKAMPKDMAGWRATVEKVTLPEQRRVDRLVEQDRRQLALAQEKLRAAEAALQDEFRRKRTPKYKRDQIAAERLSGERAAVVQSEYFLREMERRAADPNLAENDPEFAEILPAEVTAEYPRDAAGRRLPPDEYKKALAGVLEAGEAIYNDFVDAQQRDKTIYELQQKLDGEYSLAAIKKAVQEDTPDRRRLIDGRPKIRQQIKRREQELLMQLLKSVRGFGGVRHDKAQPGTTTGASGGDMRELPARSDWRERLREAEEFFPDDWLRMSADKPLTLASSRRAWHSGRRGDKATTLAMATPDRDNAVYSGAFKDETDEVTVHEMGHRMESTIPGLQELEFTFVRSRSMRGDRLEPPKKLSDVQRHSGYADYEVAFLDDWAHPYAGKTYERMSTVNGHPMVDDPDPASKPWEVFQVGLQDTLGRGDRQFGDTQLQYFVLGALATLAREETPPKRKRGKR